MNVDVDPLVSKKCENYSPVRRGSFRASTDSVFPEDGGPAINNQISAGSSASTTGSVAFFKAGLFIDPVSATTAPYRAADSSHPGFRVTRRVFPMAAPSVTSAGKATKSVGAGIEAEDARDDAEALCEFIRFPTKDR